MKDFNEYTEFTEYDEFDNQEERKIKELKAALEKYYGKSLDCLTTYHMKKIVEKIDEIILSAEIDSIELDNDGSDELPSESDSLSEDEDGYGI